MAATQPFEIRHSHAAEAMIAVLSEARLGATNEIEVGRTCEKLNAMANALQSSSLIVDLARASQIGAAFLGRLVQIAVRLRDRGRRLVICGDRWNLVGVTRLDRLMRSFPTRADAIAWCARNCITETNACGLSHSQKPPVASRARRLLKKIEKITVRTRT